MFGLKNLLFFTNILLIFLILVFVPSAETNSYGEFFGSPKTESRLLSSLIWFLILAYILLGIIRSQLLF